MIESDRVGWRADKLMLRVDSSRFRPPRRRRVVIWLLIALLPIIGLLLGFFLPHSNAIIELGNGSQFEPLDEASRPDFPAWGYLDTLAARLPGSAGIPDTSSSSSPNAAVMWSALRARPADGFANLVIVNWRPSGWRTL